MSKPTFLVISQTYPPDPASVGQHMHDAAAEMARRGYRVITYASARGYEDAAQVYPRREEKDGVLIRRLPLASFGKKSILIRLVGGFLFTLQVILRGLFTRRLAGILVSTSPPMAPLAASVIHFFRRTPVTYWGMDLNPDQMIALGKLKPKALPCRLFDWMNRSILKRAKAVVTLDRFMAERLNAKRDVSSKMHVMPPWPHDDHLDVVDHADNPFRAEHGLEGKFVVMYSGNLSIASPVTTILDAAMKLHDRDDIVFLFIGGGLGKQEVDDLIAREKPGNIRSLPYQPIETLRYSLSAADVHLVSVGEKIVGICHPCKVYGALAVARPIMLLGPRPCHVSDILDEHEVGWSIEHGDVDAAIKAIEQACDLGHDQRMALGRLARDLVDQRFSKAKLCGDFCDIMESTMGKPIERPAATESTKPQPNHRAA